jgi:hypothetical protein
VTTYQHTQIGKGILVPIIGVTLVNLYFVIRAGATPAAIVPATVAIVLLLTLFLFWKLTISVNSEVCRASFGPGFIYKEIPVNQIERCDPMRVRWWHGWGIHFTSNGWLYNISGPHAVIITLRNGRRLCFGTDEPQELQAAVLRFASAK